MKNKLKIIIALLSVCFLCIFGACSDGSGGVGSQNQDGYSSNVNFSNSVNVDSQILELDQTGLFYKTPGVTGMEYNIPIQELYSSLPSYTHPKSGVKVTADSANEGVYYSKVIDLNSFDGDLITFEVLGNATPAVKGIDVELIDIYNKDNTVKLSWFVLSADTVSNLLVNCNGVSSGCTNENPTANGLPRIQYGSIDYLSNFIGTISLVKNHAPFHFRFDNDTKEVRVDLMNIGDNFCVLDLDNPIHMGDLVWDGFTTGEVYLKISFSKITAEGSMIITSIAGKDLSGENLSPDPSNTIKLNLEDRSYAYKMPIGKVGVAYSVPTVDSYDIIRGNYNVYMMVKAPDGSVVETSNGKFTPSAAGQYNIIYSARDVNGYTIVRTLKVDVKDAIEDITFKVDKNLEEKLYTNTIEKLPVISTIGGSGKVAVDCTYTFDGKTIFADALGDYKFEKSGELSISVSAKDYLGNTASETFQYQVVDKPYINLLSSMPTGLVKGSTFVLPEFEVVSENASEYTEKSIYVNNQLVEGNSIVVPNQDDIEIAYYFEKGTEKELCKRFNLSITDTVTYTNLKNMFITKGATVTHVAGGLAIETNKNDNLSVFTNPISADLMEINLRTVENKTAFEYIQITLTDTIFNDNQIAFRFYTSTNLTENFRIQDEYGSFNYYKYPIYHKISIPERNHIYYDNASRSIYNVNLGLLAKVLYRTDGKTFNGFESGGVNVSITFGGVSGDASMVIEQLGNQSFKLGNMEFGDLSAPELAVKGVLDTSQHILGSNLFIPKAIAIDVLNLTSYVTVSLKSPNGSYIFEEEDCDVERNITLDKVGIYTLQYTLEDGAGNINADKTYYIYVVDKESPTISGEIKLEDTYKLDSKIKFTDFTTTDNFTAETDIEKYILIISPTYKYFYISGEKEFVFDEDGEYRIQYVAKDTSDNYTVKEYKVKVA